MLANFQASLPTFLLVVV